MAVHRAPQKFFDAFDGNEADKAAARSGVIEWIKAQMQIILDGETVIIPDGLTGEEIQFTKQRMNN